MLSASWCPCSSSAAHTVGPFLAWAVLLAIVAATVVAGLRARRARRDHESRSPR